MVHLVSSIDVKDFGAETLRIGDLNADGAPDFLFVQSIYGTREITCLTATTITGEVLWQTGKASPENGRIYSDLPVQIYDWDGDGRNEVLYVRQARYIGWTLVGGYARERAERYEGVATMVVLDGATGKEKSSFPLPAPADDCFLFADLRGCGRREDLIVKDRYWNMWGVAHSGDVLWHWPGSTGHFPAVADLDGDGRDEVFVGYALIDHDGKVLFAHDPGDAHQDAVYVIRNEKMQWRLLFGNGGIHCLALNGETLWHHPLHEAQHVIAGRFRADSPLQCMVVNRGRQRTVDGEPATLHLYDLDGREIWHKPMPYGSWAAAVVLLDWFGPGELQTGLVYSRGPRQPAAIYDGNGAIVDELEMTTASYRTAEERSAGWYALSADVWGDSRQEAILFGSRGACVYANSPPHAIASLYNSTLYPGM
jgi:outer membrane protein assembly factor BamB